MFTLISKQTKQAARLIGCAALITSLSGCFSGALERIQSLGLPRGEAHRMVMRDGIVLSLPSTLCIDATHSKPEQGFALVAACDRFSKSEDPKGNPAYATVQLGAKGSASVKGQEAALAGLLLSEASGDFVEGSSISDVDVGANQVIAQAGPQSDKIWRLFKDQRDILVAVTVRDLPSLDATDAQGRNLLTQVAASVR